jgi:hypothetical protein
MLLSNLFGNLSHPCRCLTSLCLTYLEVGMWWTGDERSLVAAPVELQGNLNASSSNPFGFLLLVLSRR